MRVDPAVWREVFKRDGGRCRYCSDDLLSSFSRYWCATVDHVHAVAAGGGDGIDNLVLACPACNGMLSRASDLRTFDARAAFVQKRREAVMSGYAGWLRDLRSGAAAVQAHPDSTAATSGEDRNAVGVALGFARSLVEE